MLPVQSQEWKVEFFVPQATNSIWRRETRTMATPMRSLSVGVAKSVREWFLDRRGRGFDDCVHRRRSIAKSVQKRSRLMKEVWESIGNGAYEPRSRQESQR